MRGRRFTSAIERDDVDLLLVSPERFNNPAFRADVLPTVAARSGLFVIDEAAVEEAGSSTESSCNGSQAGGYLYP